MTPGTANNYRTGGLERLVQHRIEVGDPKLGEAFCLDCSFRVTRPTRNQLRAAAFRHIADVLDPPESESA